MLRREIELETSGVQERDTISEVPRERPRMRVKDVIWKAIALIVVLILAVIFVMIGMKLAWIGG